jgi:hypothetical protein
MSACTLSWRGERPALTAVARSMLDGKDFSFVFSESVLISRHPASCRGTYASSRYVEVGCDGRDGCARRAQSVRTAKSCGPGLSTLRSSSRQLLDGTRERWGQESPIPRESTKDTVKTNRAGKAGSSGWTCGTCRLHSLTQAGRRHQPMPGLPRALSFFRGTRLLHHPGAARRGKRGSCLLFRRPGSRGYRDR